MDVTLFGLKASEGNEDEGATAWRNPPLERKVMTI